MDLILWRHAEAHDAAPEQDDLSRGLTTKGERQAARMAHWLNHVLPATARVLVSPALRTQQTAKALDRKFRLCEALAPGRSAADLLQAARWPQSREAVLVVGHQPTLGQVAAHLLGEGPLDDTLPAWRIRKGGVWWLRRRDDRERDERDGVLLVTVRSPEMP